MRPSPSSQPESGPGADASARSLHGLDWLNFFLSDVQTGVGPLLAIYLAGNGWNEQTVGLALTAGGVIALALGTLLIASRPAFWSVLAAQVIIGGAASIVIPTLCAIALGLFGAGRFDARQGRSQAFNAAGTVAAAVLYFSRGGGLVCLGLPLFPHA